jgi:diaminopimelate decarboxylase
MDHFIYKNGILHAEEVPIPLIAEKISAPFYCYSSATITRHYKVFADSFADINALVCFAVKANSNQAVLATLARAGSGADCVSQGEIIRALKAGIPADKIVFSGVGKTREEIAYSLREKIFQINVESESELMALSQVAQSMGVVAQIAIRINPDVDAKTHAKISTGKKDHKFGIPAEQAADLYKLAASLPGISVVGVATHIGSQLMDLEPFSQAFLRVENLVQQLRADGHQIKRLDLGGGLGIPYYREVPPSPDNYAKMVKKSVQHLGCMVMFEPGRLIVGNAGILVTRVIYIKKNREGRRFVIVDSGMNDLLRPTLYDAYHHIISVQETKNADVISPADVVGPVCETGDRFAVDRMLPELAEDDLLAIRSCGAYGAVMSSTYNTRPLIPEILVNGADWAVVRKRPSYEEMLALEQIPDWL